jgi:hypothetical protein
MSTNRIVTAVAIVAAAAWVGAAAAAEHSCITVRVGDPIVLPDGSEQPAGRLTLCGAATFSPIAQFQRTSVNGRPVGLFLSRTRIAEENSDGPPFVTFARSADGRLLLLGYAVPSRSSTKAYIFDDAWRLAARGEGRSPWVAGATALTMVAAAR